MKMEVVGKATQELESVLQPARALWKREAGRDGAEDGGTPARGEPGFRAGAASARWKREDPACGRQRTGAPGRANYGTRCLRRKSGKVATVAGSGSGAGPVGEGMKPPDKTASPLWYGGETCSDRNCANNRGPHTGSPGRDEAGD